MPEKNDTKPAVIKPSSTEAGRARACAFLLEHGFSGAPSDAGSILVDARPQVAHVQAGDLVAALRGAGLPVRPFTREAGEGISIRVFFDPIASTASIEVFGMSDQLFPESPKPSA